MIQRIPVLLTLTTLAVALCAEGSNALRSIECYVAVEEGASAEGTRLFLERMALSSEVLRAFVPTSYTIKKGVFTASAEGSQPFRSSSPRPIERAGKLGLYAVEVEARAPLAPKSEKDVTVEFKFSQLFGKTGLIQPGLIAIEIAARKLGWDSGRAWVSVMTRPRAGLIRSVVSFARP